MPFIIGFLSRIFVAFFSRLSAWAVGFISTLAGPLATAFLKLTSNLSKLLLGAAAICFLNDCVISVTDASGACLASCLLLS